MVANTRNSEIVRRHEIKFIDGVHSLGDLDEIQFEI